jgi:prolyl-tRNA synthetase
VEQNHDDKGIVWPFPIAPFHVQLISLGQSTAAMDAATSLYHALEAAGLEVLWDDRDERAGVKFNDADLIGAPYQVIVGDKGLAEGLFEVKHRSTGVKTKIASAGIPAAILSMVSTHTSS